MLHTSGYVHPPPASFPPPTPHSHTHIGLTPGYLTRVQPRFDAHGEGVLYEWEHQAATPPCQQELPLNQSDCEGNPTCAFCLQGQCAHSCGRYSKQFVVCL